MIIWTGRGILVPLVFMILLIIFIIIYADPGTPFSISSTLGSSLLFTGLFSYYFGNLWHKAPGKVYIDKDSGEEVELKPKHSFFWLKMEYWGVIGSVLGMGILLMGLI